MKNTAEKAIGDFSRVILLKIEESLLYMDALKNLAAITSGTGPALVAQIAVSGKKLE